jgi:L-ascorbate metabolism protein UlaG (beta-lactamase superfamily)
MHRMKMVVLCVIFFASVWLAACQPANLSESGDNSSAQPSPIPVQTRAASETVLIPTFTHTPVEHLEEPTQSPQPPATQIPTQMLEMTGVEACVRLYYQDYAQVELIGVNNERVLIDIYDPGKLSHPVQEDRSSGEQDVLLTTHTHFDHINDAFLASFTGQQLFARSGKLSLPGVAITGIPSAHNAGDRLKEEGGSNYIFLVELGGLRIAHFGDIGQAALTQEQLDLLGRVDIAITQFANPYSDMNIQNRKGFNLMEQVQPGWIIPTHLNLETAAAAVNQWKAFYTDQPFVHICESQLPGETHFLLMGENARQFAERLSLAKYE